MEIYEGDPFTGCCGPGISSVATIEKLQKMLMERDETVKTLIEEFHGEVKILSVNIEKTGYQNGTNPNRYNSCKEGSKGS